MIEYMPFLLLLFVMLNVKAQIELVPNGSFEIISDCPTMAGQISNAIGWSSYRETPDLCNACAGVSPLGVPSNYFGYQVASDGYSYAAIFTYVIGGLFREIIGAPLNQTLVPLKNYKISFKISTGYGMPQYRMASNKMGVRFSTMPFSTDNPPPIDNFAHLYIDTVVSDTSNWVVFAQDWIADSAYQYIMLGNFFDDLHTDTLQLDSFFGAALYYVDEVSVIDENKVGIEESNSSEITLNWKENLIILNAGENTFEKVSIVNVIGQTIIEIGKMNSGTTSTFNLSNLYSGMYFFVMLGEGKQIVKKFLKP